MNVKRLLNTQLGQMFISIFLGIGLATLFRKVCKDKDCIIFNGPVISETENKIYKYDDKCYNYDITPTICNEEKRIINIVEPKIEPLTQNDHINNDHYQNFIGL